MWHSQATTSVLWQRTIQSTLPCAKETQFIHSIEELTVHTGNLLVRPTMAEVSQSPASHRDGPGSIPCQVMWDLWWTEWYWGAFSTST
jgi:hypothetical protein